MSLRVIFEENSIEKFSLVEIITEVVKQPIANNEKRYGELVLRSE